MPVHVGPVGGVALEFLKTADAAMLRLKTSAASSTNGELEKAGDSRASRGEGKVLRVRIYTPPAFKVLKKLLLFLEKGGAIAPFAPWLRHCTWSC